MEKFQLEFSMSLGYLFINIYDDFPCMKINSFSIIIFYYFLFIEGKN